MNLDLFADEPPRPPVRVWRGWRPDHVSRLDALRSDLPWVNRQLGESPMPRLECLLGPPGTSYTYSGLRYDSIPMEAHHLVGYLLADVEQATGHEFNAAFCNLYRDGSDSIGWHRDNEPILGRPSESVIASVSLGAHRRFAMREVDNPSNRQTWDLGGGDLLLMGPGCQSRWEHCATKTARRVGPRIVLTFRRMEVRGG